MVIAGGCQASRTSLLKCQTDPQLIFISMFRQVQAAAAYANDLKLPSLDREAQRDLARSLDILDIIKVDYTSKAGTGSLHPGGCLEVRLWQLVPDVPLRAVAQHEGGASLCHPRGSPGASRTASGHPQQLGVRQHQPVPYPGPRLQQAAKQLRVLAQSYGMLDHVTPSSSLWWQWTCHKQARR